MGQTTPNMGIYIPAAGETNYDASFAAGMVNVDQHNHSGGPNEGVPIASSGLADGAVTYEKLASNVVTSGSGLTTQTGSLANQITTTGLLNSIATLVTPVGLLAANGSTATPVTITGTANQVNVANGSGAAGNPTLSLPSTIYTNISFDSGAHTLNSYTSGTFTPNLAFGGSSTGITYSTQTGKYWKVGAVVYFCINLFLTSAGSATGAATVTGLPFTSANDGFVQTIPIQCFLSSYPSGTTYIVGELNPNSNDIAIAACGAANQTAVLNSNFNSSSELTISGFYWTA